MTTQPRTAPTPAPVPRPAGANGTAPKSAAVAPTKQSRLGSAKRERLRDPHAFLWYGPEGVGKTSLIADMPSPILIDIEGGSAEIEITRYMFRDEPGGHIPRSYEDILTALDDLTANPGHGYKTLGIDTADALEAMIHAFICKRDGEENIEKYGYGKGYKVAVAELRIFISRLNALRYRQGMQIAIAAHAKSKQFKNPEGPDYDRWNIVGHDEFTAELRARCDTVGFVHFEGGGAKLADEGKSKTARARGWATGRRVIELVRTAAWDAKTRLAVGSQVELAQVRPFRPFAEAKLLAQDATVESLTAEMLNEIDRITGGNRDLEFTASNGKTTTGNTLVALPDLDVTALARIVSGLRSIEPVVSLTSEPSQES